MPVSILPLNQTQKITETPVIERTVLQPHTYYTCPVGKKAKIIGSCVCDGMGAAANSRLEANDVPLCYWATNGTVSAIHPRLIGVPFIIDLTLSAGQTLTTKQDIGTNSEFIVAIKVLELPA